jgi:alpha-L-fucosidase
MNSHALFSTALVTSLCLASLTLAAKLAGQTPPSGEQVTDAERIQWFQQDKFGMFIHWGPYSALAGEWKGQRIPVGNEAEWVMERFNIPVAEYREKARQFNPVHFDAEAWVALAKAAGMKYLVVTAKHHDGFAMYASKVSKYNIVDWTPFHRDPLQELAEACKKAGIRFCVYYSHREDWDHPDAYGNDWDYDISKKDFARYLEEKSKPQLRELLSNYGPLGLVWFDRGMDTPEHGRQFVEIVRQLQPRCLINGRVGGYGLDLLGDYQSMGDNGMPADGLQEYWETPQTLNTTWGFSRFDQQWKTPGDVIHRMVEIVSKGGNYLLNIGPMGDGTIPAPSVDTLRKVGAWVQANGASIYGTSASPLREQPWGFVTVKGDRLYLHVFSWPGDGVLRLPGLKNELRTAYTLADPSHKLALHRTDGNVAITLPAKPLDEHDTVIVLQLDGPPAVDPPVVTQDTDPQFALDYQSAVTAGKAVKRFNVDGGFHLAKWTGPEDTITWNLLVSHAGQYQVRISYSARKESNGARYLVTVGGQTLTAAVAETGEGLQYKKFDLGNVRLAKAGAYTLQVRPAVESGRNLMYFQKLEMVREGSVMIE